MSTPKRKGINEAKLKAAADTGEATAFLKHLGTIGWDDDRPRELVALIRRAGPLMLPRPSPQAEASRDRLLADLRTHLLERAPEAAPDFDAAQNLLQRAEEGYRRILAYRAQQAFALWPGERLAGVLIAQAERRLQEVSERVEAALKRDGLTVPGTINVGDDDGPPVDPDSVLDMVVSTLGGTLIMEAYARDWFDVDGAVRLPPLPVPSPDDFEEGAKDEALGTRWMRWNFMEETARFLDGTLDLGGPQIPGLELPPNITRVLHGPCVQDEYDFIANARFRDRSGIVSYDLASLAAGDIPYLGIEGVTPLPPEGLISEKELTQGHMLSQRLGFDITTDTGAPGGLRLLTWVRGYVALSTWVGTRERPDGVLTATNAELTDLLHRVGLDPEETTRLLKALAFGKRSRDLFDTPLVRTGEDWIVVGPALAHVDAAKVVPSMLASRKVQIARKGDAFNQTVLELLINNGLGARSVTRKFGADEFDYDVLVPWGDYLFLFECKNYGLSNGEPKEVMHFRQELASAFGQVQRLVEALGDHPDILQDEWGEEVETKTLVPCILFNEPYARDHDIDGIFVYDFSALSRFFDSSAFHANRDHRLPDGRIARVQADILRIWASEAPTPKDLLAQLKSPFQLRLVDAQLDCQSVVFALDESTAAISDRLTRKRFSEDEMMRALGADPAQVKAVLDRGTAEVEKLKGAAS